MVVRRASALQMTKQSVTLEPALMIVLILIGGRGLGAQSRVAMELAQGLEASTLKANLGARLASALSRMNDVVPPTPAQ